MNSGVGIANNVSPSLHPFNGALATDVSIPGSLYIGNDGGFWAAASTAAGLAFVDPQPNVVVSGNLAYFPDGGINVISDSGIPESNVVQQSTLSTGGNLSVYADNTGRLLNDVGISITSYQVTISLLSNAGNPNLSGIIFLVKTTVDNATMVTFTLMCDEAITTTTLPDFWQTTTLPVPLAFRPLDDSYFPGFIKQGTSLIPGYCEMSATGNVVISINASTPTGSTLFQNFSGNYRNF